MGRCGGGAQICGSSLFPRSSHHHTLLFSASHPEMGGTGRSGVVFLSPAILKLFVYVGYVFGYLP